MDPQVRAKLEYTRVNFINLLKHHKTRESEFFHIYERLSLELLLYLFSR